MAAAGYLSIVTSKRKNIQDVFIPSVSVVIPFRNEIENLPLLIKHLSSQEYSGSVEFIFADDHSEDGSADFIQSSIFTGAICLLSVPGIVGKKATITRAIQFATGEIILTTDADCCPGPHWVSSMAKPFSMFDTKMVLGPVALSGKNYFGRLQSAEFLSLMAVTRISSDFHQPLMANGANLAYRKSVFDFVGGYTGNDKISSGDDEFLMRKIHKYFPRGIIFQNDISALVSSRTAESLTEFFRQRIRWAGKWRHNENLLARFLAVAVFGLQVLTIILLVNLIASPSIWHLVLLFRFIPEYILLKTFAKSVSVVLPLKDYLTIALLYPFYVIITALMSIFYSPEWKGRVIK